MSAWNILEVFQRRALIIAVEVNGQEVCGLADTGAGMSLVDTRHCERLGLAASDETASVKSEAGGGLLSRLNPFVVTAGGRSIKFSNAAIADLHAASSALGRDLAIVLGRDLFDATVVDLDMPCGRYRFLDSEPELAGHQRLDILSWHGGAPTVGVGIEGARCLPAIVDLGSSAAIMVSRPAAVACGLLDGRRSSTAAIAQVTGVATSITCSIKQLRIGPFTLNDVPCDIIDDAAETREQVNIGLPLLARFRVTADFKGGRIWLAPELCSLAAAFDRDLTGLGFAVLPDRLRIVHVAAGGPAASGWRVGDEIVAVNGRKIDQDYARNALWRWRFGGLGTDVGVTLSDGSQRRLRLQRYF